MKEICHKELARLVGTHGSSPVEPEDLEIMVNATVEPDQIDRKRFSENFFYGIKWLFNHTIGAKKLAVNYIRKASEAHAWDNRSWSRCLGFAFHFIADWATPHHSPTSNSNPILDFTQAGVQLGGTIGGIYESGNSLEDELIGFLKGALIGGGIFGGIGTIFLYFSHRNFESRCDERWEENAQLVTKLFREKVGHQQLPDQYEQALDLFEKKMNNLSQLCENLPAIWINTCDDAEYADYMVEIALVMDCACQIVMMNK